MKKTFLLAVLLCISSFIFAQTFDFTPSVTHGCTPLLVIFSNTSDPNVLNTYRYEWVVEPGKFSTETNQVINSYLQPGVYTAQMKVFDKHTNMLVETVSKNIQAFNDPDVQITSDKAESCVFKPFQFSISKTTSDAPIASYMWILSDGATYPTETPPPHVFTYAGRHTIFCAVTDTNGCTNRERHTIHVTTYDDAPQTTFSVDKNSTCDPTLRVQFTNTSPADPNLARFEWDFGDGSPVNSSAQNPAHTYNGYGTYRATLKNVSIHDCETAVSTAIRLIDYQPDFIISDEGKEIDGNKACHGTITFVENSQPANSTRTRSWDYGADGTVEGTAQQHTVHELTGGIKRMKLTVNNGVCERSVTKSFEVETPLQISYTPTNEFFCEQSNVNYVGTSNVPNSTFDWNINGNRKYGQSVSQFFGEEGLYSDTLTVITPNGCSDTIAKPNNIELVFPQIELSITSRESGCAPLAVSFKEERIYNTTRDAVVNVEWDFDYQGTFTVDATGFNQASWTHANRGVYQTVVRATTDKGCVIYDYAIDNIPNNEKEIVKVGNTPSADLFFSDTVICADTPLKFKYKNGDDANSPMNTAYDSLFLSLPHWYPNRWGPPGDLFVAPANREFLIFLRDSVGEHRVFYTLSDHGCRSTPEQDFDVDEGIYTTIHVHGPILDIQAPNKNCNDNYTYMYHFRQKINVDYDSPNQHVEWFLQKVGNQTPPMFVARNQDTIHINFRDTIHPYFGEPDGRGDYIIFAVGYNGDEECFNGVKCFCDDTVFVSTRITDIKADFTVNSPTPCLGDETFIHTGPNAQDVARWNTYWVKDGIQYYADTVAFSFDSKNITGIDVITADEFGCPASMRIPVKVYQPEADFVATITSDCLPFTTVFSDLTSWDTDTTIISRSWDFGNGTPSHGTDSVHTVLFEHEGFVSPSLTVTDILGCTDTIVVSNYIKPIVPNSKFTVATPKLCLNHDALFSRTLNVPSLSDSIHRFTWDFGDGTIISGTPGDFPIDYLAETVRHKYTQESTPGTFNISLTAYSYSLDGIRECEATTPGTIEVKDVNAHIEILEMDKCKEPGQMFIVYIDNAWYSGKYQSMKWNKIDNDVTILVTESTVAPRAITFPNYGMQSIELITRSDYAGCETDADTVEFDVPGYEVEFEANKYLVCVDEEITFTRTRAVNVDAYESYWSFGDGVLDFDNLEESVHAYSTLPDTENERFKVQYIVDAPNCKPQDIFRLIELHPVEANFLRGIDDIDSINCAPNTVEFINTSVGSKNNVYKWNFGDGNTSTEKNPTHTFIGRNEPYEVSLSLEGVACNDTTTKKVYFYPKPNVQFDYDEMLCLGESTAINAQGNFNAISWKPAQYFSNPNSAITNYQPQQSGMAYVDITSQYGCTEEDSLFVFVQQRPRYQGAPDSALLYYRTPTQIVLTGRPDSKLIAGEIYNVNNTPVEGVMYEWSPGDYLSCIHCISPDIHLECGTPGYPSCFDFPDDLRYSIYMYDTLGCFEETAEIQFLIVIETKAALPQAFTPNGDGNNDIAFVRGWGIKELLEVKIYNRWGQLLFESSDLHHGWDGRYNGKDQPMETYSYTLRYKDKEDKEQFAKGYITLIR